MDQAKNVSTFAWNVEKLKKLNLENYKFTETRQTKVVFHNVINDNLCLFGGEAMKWMDEVAYITAARLTGQKMVTVSVNKINFLKQISLGSFVEVVGKIESSTNVKLNIKVEIFVEQKGNPHKELAIEGTFVMASINEEGKPLRLKILSQD